MRYKIIAWHTGLISTIFKTDDTAKVNFYVKELRKLGAEEIEVFERETLTRKVYGWTK